MADRATWKGFLKLRLLQIPIKVYPATSAADGLSFNQLHEPCHTRIQQRRWCQQCAREVTHDEIVKGYEFEPGKYVILLPDELEAVQPESTRVIDLVRFGGRDALELLSIDRAYYVAPDDAGGAAALEAYGVLREALRGKVGIGKLAIYGREYLVAVRPQAPARQTLMLYTLHHDAEIRRVDTIEALNAAPPAVPRDAVKLAQLVIANMPTGLELSAFSDGYQAGVQRLIDAKIAGEEVVSVQPSESAPLPLRAALERSLEAVRAEQKPARRRAS